MSTTKRKRTVTITINDLLQIVLIVIGAIVLIYELFPPPVEVSFGSGAHLYVFGASTGPYYRSLEKLFSEEYANRYYFCMLDKDYSCKIKKAEIVELLTSKYISNFYLKSIPQTFVVVDGKYVTAIVIGGITDPEFWENVTRREPGEFVLIVSHPFTSEIYMTYEEQMKLINILKTHGILEGNLLIYLLLAVFVACSIVTWYVFLEKKETSSS